MHPQLARDDANRWNEQAVLHKRQGQVDQAITCYRKAITACHDFAEAWYNLGLALHERGRLGDAQHALEKARDLRPDVPLIRLSLGSLALTQGAIERACESFRSALHLRADFPEASFNLAHALMLQGKWREAIDHLESVRRHPPLAPRADVSLGNVYRQLGDFQKAVQCYRRALAAAPDMPEALANLGVTLKSLGQTDAALQCLHEVAKKHPSLAEPLTNLGNIYRDRGDVESARAWYMRACNLQPEQPLTRLRIAALWPLVFSCETEMESFRDELQSTIRDLRAQLENLSPQKIAATAVEPPHVMQFQKENLRPWKESYASIFADSFAKQPPIKSLLAPGDRIRIGIVVTRGHEPIFLRTMKGILERLEADEFEASVMCAASGAAAIRRSLPNVRLMNMPEQLSLAAETIRNERFDILHYWEIGTDWLNYFLPFMRLAPVQSTSWGVQVTSGIPTVDYYISSRLLETGGFRDHYSEQVLLLETLPTLQEPISIPPRAGRDAFGLRDDQHVYLCAQNLGKLHLDFDAVIADILRRDPRGRLVLTADTWGHAARRLQERFAKTMPDVVERVTFVPRQTRESYLQLISVADVLLDPPYFSGANSTYDGLALGKPIITCPTGFQRGRYTWACYQKMGMDQFIAADWTEYAWIAVQYGSDADRLRSIESELRERSACLFGDDASVRDHERIFREMVANANARSSAA